MCVETVMSGDCFYDGFVLSGMLDYYDALIQIERTCARCIQVDGALYYESK